MQALGHDIAIPLNGHAFTGIAQLLDQLGDGHRGGELAWLAI
jgi:hypothetical protein